MTQISRNPWNFELCQFLSCVVQGYKREEMVKRETWFLKVELPRDVANGGRYMARLLKHLLRTWGVKCVALLDTPQESHHFAQDRRSDAETARPLSRIGEREGEREND